jgi:hypothetical protein
VARRRGKTQCTSTLSFLSFEHGTHVALARTLIVQPSSTPCPSKPSFVKFRNRCADSSSTKGRRPSSSPTYVSCLKGIASTLEHNFQLLTRPAHSIIHQAFDSRLRVDLRRPINGDGFGVGTFRAFLSPLPCHASGLEQAGMTRYMTRNLGINPVSILP